MRKPRAIALQRSGLNLVSVAITSFYCIVIFHVCIYAYLESLRVLAAHSLEPSLHFHLAANALDTPPEAFPNIYTKLMLSTVVILIQCFLFARNLRQTAANCHREARIKTNLLDILPRT